MAPGSARSRSRYFFVANKPLGELWSTPTRPPLLAADFLTCYIVHGVPAAPRPVMRTDRRYGPRVPGRY
jgi:hypothetical protein